MKKDITLKFLFLAGVPLVLAMFSSKSSAQAFGADLGGGVWGSGAGSMMAGCQYATRPPTTIDLNKDVEINISRLAKSDADERLKDKVRAFKAAKEARLESRRALLQALGFTAYDEFERAAKDCQTIMKDLKLAEKAVTGEGVEIRNSRLEKRRNELLNKNFEMNITSHDFQTQSPWKFKESCTDALGGPEEFLRNNYIKEEKLCGMATFSRDASGRPNIPVFNGDHQKCVLAANGYIVILEAENVAERELKDARAAYAKAKRESERTVERRRREIEQEEKEKRELEKEMGESDVVNFVDSATGAGLRACPNGTCQGVRVFGAGNNLAEAFDKIGPWILGASLGSAGIQGLVENANARRARNLGYPTGPNMWINPAMNIANGLMSYAMLNAAAHANYGYPMAAGNINGGVPGAIGVGGLGCAQTIGSPIYSNVGQVGNIMGPYSVNQNSFPNGMVMNRGPGVFNPMYNGQIGVNPAFNGQVILGSNGNPMVTCFTAPCNVGGIGNSPVGVWNGGGGGYNSGYNQGSFTGIDVASICMANPMACQGINGGGWTGSSNPYALGPGGSSFYQLQEMNDQRRLQQARELQAQSYSLMSGVSGYNGMGGGYFNGMGVGGFNLSAGISAGVRLPGLVPMASPLIGPGFPQPQSTTIGR